MNKEEVLKLMSELQNKLSDSILCENLYTINYGEQTDYIKVVDALDTIETLIRRTE